MKRLGINLAGWLLGSVVLLLRITCRRRFHNDPRPELSRSGTPQIFGTLHAMQLACSMAAERGSGTMVSRSADGEILIPGLKLGGIVPIRGSSGRHSKGGAIALHRLIRHAKTGKSVIMAIDGPRGPRGVVQKGIGLLAEKSERCHRRRGGDSKTTLDSDQDLGSNSNPQTLLADRLLFC